MGGIGEVPDIVFRSIATVSQATDVAGGQLLSHEVEDISGQLTTGTIRHIELLGLLGFEIEF